MQKEFDFFNDQQKDLKISKTRTSRNQIQFIKNALVGLLYQK